MANTIECAKNGYLSAIEALMTIRTESQPFSNNIDTNPSDLVSPKRTVGAGFTVSKTTSLNSSGIVRSNPNPLLFTANATTNQTIGFAPIALNLSQNFFNYKEDGFLVIPIYFTNVVGNQALTQAQRTVLSAVRTTDTVPKIYGSSAVAIGTLTPTIVDPRFTNILGDSTNTGAMDLRGTIQKIKIPLEILNDGAGVAVNISTTQTLDSIQLLLTGSIGMSFEYYNPEVYATPDFYCPDETKITLKDITSIKIGTNLYEYQDVENLRKEVVGAIKRQGKAKVSITVEGLDLNLIRKVFGVATKIGGKRKPTFNNITVPATGVYISTDIDTAIGSENITVYGTNGQGCQVPLTVIEGGSPLSNQVQFVKNGATNKLVFNPIWANQKVSVRVIGVDSSRVSASMKEAKRQIGSLALVLGNSDTVASSTTFNNFDYLNFFVDATANIYAQNEGKLSDVTLELTQTASSDLVIDGDNCF